MPWKDLIFKWKIGRLYRFILNILPALKRKYKLLRIYFKIFINKFAELVEIKEKCIGVKRMKYKGGLMLKKLTYYLVMLSFLLGLSLHRAAEAREDCSSSPGIEFTSKIRYVNNNGVQIAYTSDGKHHRQSIVFIHGLPFSGEEFICQIKALKKFFHVVTVDLRGFGHSDKSLNIEYSYPAYVSDVTAVINHLGLKKPVIAGFSFGSVVAELYAATNPNISKLILISPFAGQVVNANGFTAGIDPAFLASLIALANVDRNAANEAFLNLAVPETCCQATAVKNYLLPIVEELPTANLNKFVPVLATGITGLLPSISVPTLALFGSIDTLINKQGVFLLTELIPNSRLIEFYGGHMINLTQSKGVNQAILEFVKSDPFACHTCL